MGFLTLLLWAVFWNAPWVVAAEDKDAKSQSCCVGRVGDCNGVGGDEPTIGDISFMIGALFVCGGIEKCWEPSCLMECDVTQSAENVCVPQPWNVSIGDIAYLIGYLFVSLPFDSLGNPSGMRLPECPQCPPDAL